MQFSLEGKNVSISVIFAGFIVGRGRRFLYFIASACQLASGSRFAVVAFRISSCFCDRGNLLQHG